MHFLSDCSFCHDGTSLYTPNRLAWLLLEIRQVTISSGRRKYNEIDTIVGNSLLLRESEDFIQPDSKLPCRNVADGSERAQFLSFRCIEKDRGRPEQTQ